MRITLSQKGQNSGTAHVPRARRRSGTRGRNLRAAMDAEVFRGLAVAGGGESSDSDDDGWEIGYLDRSTQVAKEAWSSPSLAWFPWLPLCPKSLWYLEPGSPFLVFYECAKYKNLKHSFFLIFDSCQVLFYITDLSAAQGDVI